MLEVNEFSLIKIFNEHHDMTCEVDIVDVYDKFYEYNITMRSEKTHFHSEFKVTLSSTSMSMAYDHYIKEFCKQRKITCKFIESDMYDSEPKITLYNWENSE